MRLKRLTRAQKILLDRKGYDAKNLLLAAEGDGVIVLADRREPEGPRLVLDKKELGWTW